MCIRKKYHEGFALHVALIFALSVYKLDMKFFQEFPHGFWPVLDVKKIGLWLSKSQKISHRLSKSN